MTPQLPLGSELITLTLAVRGRLTVQGADTLAKRVIHAVKMRIPQGPEYKAKVWTFPTNKNEGGVGYTYIQPLVESFLAIDWWKSHEGFFLCLHSCRPYNHWGVIDLINSLAYVIHKEDGTVEYHTYSVVTYGGSVVWLNKRPSWLRRLISWFGWG